MKLYLMSSFLGDLDIKDIPDPYYGGNEGFHFVFDLLEQACDQLLKDIICNDR